MDKTHSIREMKNLRDNLNKYEEEPISYTHNPEAVLRGKNIENTVIDEMQGRNPSDTFCGVSDIVAGVCRLDHYGQKHRNTPLSQNRVYNILKSMEIINTREVMAMCGFGERQARYYVKACEIIIPKLEDHFEEHGDFLEVDDFLGL